MKKIIVTCRQGMCNRLRVIFTWRAAERREWAFVWSINGACPGGFSEVFQPIPGVEILDGGCGLPVDVDGWKTHSKWGDSGVDLYDGLLPAPGVSAAAREKIQSMGGVGSYVSVHYRSTDLTVHLRKRKMGTNTTPQRLMEFIDSCPRRMPIWLATDCLEGQELFRARYGERIVCNAIDPSKNLRQTSVVDAAVDAYVCMLSKHHAGCWISSFSSFIQRHRNRVPLRRRMEILGMKEPDLFFRPLREIVVQDAKAIGRGWDC